MTKGKRRRRRKKNGRLALLLVCACLVLGVALLLPLFSGDDSENVDESEQGLFASIFAKEGREAEEELPPPPEPIDLSIVCAGDIMAHATQLKAQDMGRGVYDFKNNFAYIKKYIEAADLAICNVETTFGEAPYTGYPSFSTPDSLAEAIADAGFDVASTANNHMLDRGKKGLIRTLDILWANGLKTTGSIKDPNAQQGTGTGGAAQTLGQGSERFAMYNAKGVDIAVIAYTYQTPTNNRSVSINGSIISSELASHINSFGYEYIDEELVKINGTVEAARTAGADIVVLFYHWGEEYQLSANKWQRYIAEKTVEQMDIDVIFGSHPHVLQEAEMYTKSYVDEASGETRMKNIPVFFSLGNFISNQRNETLSNKYTEQGVIAKVDIRMMPDTNEILEVKLGAIPTWVDRYSSGDKTYYYIIPLDEDLQTNETLAASGHLSRALDAWEEANGLLGID